MQALVSAFLFALITDRVLLIDWPANNVSKHWNKEEIVAMVPLSHLFNQPFIDWDYQPLKQRIELKIKNNLLIEGAAHYPGQPSGYKGVEDVFQCYV